MASTLLSETPTTSAPAPLAELDRASIAAPKSASLLGMSLSEHEDLAERMGTSRYRGRQVFRAVFHRLVEDFTAMSDLSRSMQLLFTANAEMRRPRQDLCQISSDGTRKYRFVAEDQTAFEAVYIPEVATGRKTNTLCISSQSGCAVGCKFCFTASIKRNRNLSAAEIVGQVAAVQADVLSLGESAKVTNLVFMGMGEPLLNLKEVIRAIRILCDPLGMAFSGRRITVSTSGIVPRMAELGAAVDVQLAISLNATTDAIRTQIMPINKKWGLDALMEALRSYPLPPRRQITVEYVLLGGVNDSDDDARRLVRLARQIPHKINLLPLNAHDRTEFTPPSPARVQSFQQILRDSGCRAFIRTPRGQDISAACGQLGEAVLAHKDSQVGAA